MTRSIWLPLAAVLLLGCGGGSDGKTRVLVTVRSNQPLTDVRQLEVTATSSGGMTSFFAPETAATSAISLPVTFSVAFPKDRSGQVTVRVVAHGSGGVVLSSGEASATLTAGETVNLDVVLGGGVVMDGGVD